MKLLEANNRYQLGLDWPETPTKIYTVLFLNVVTAGPKPVVMFSFSLKSKPEPPRRISSLCQNKIHHMSCNLG